MSQLTFEDALGIGKAGEADVSRAFKRCMGEHEFLLLDNLLFRVKIGRREMFAQCDHILVDSRGLLLFETKRWTQAYLLGRDFDRCWTARYPNGENKPEYNPLRQSEQHELVVLHALNDSGWTLKPDDVDSLVVFVDARDISHLALKTRNRRRVLRVEQIPELIGRRRKACESRRGLSIGQVVGLANHLRKLDWSQDRAVVERFENSHRQRRRDAVRSNNEQMRLAEAG